MISDFVKGKARFQYPEAVQKGIMLHRQIDAFTDAHAATKEAMVFFKPHYRLYSGAIIDVLYDHFIATDINIFPQQSLYTFSMATYKTLEENTHLLPGAFNRMLPYMKAQNWLYNYGTKEGIERSLKGLVHRAAYMYESETALAIFNTEYEELKKLYAIFIADVKNFAKQQFDILIA